MVWLGSIAAVLILVAGFGIWRLIQGPVELDRLIPYVQQALERSGAGLSVAVAGVSVAIDRETHQLDLQAKNVRLTLPSGEKLANFPQMATSFSLGALLGGRLEPTRLTVERPVLLLTRDAGGKLSFQIGDPGQAARGVGFGNPLDLFGPLHDSAPWSLLRQITIRDATVIIDDRQTGHVWRANRVAATLARGDEGVDGDLSFSADLGGNAPELHASYRLAAAAQHLDLKLAVDGLDPTALAPLAPVLAPLAQAQMPVSGTIALRFDLAGDKVEAGRLDLGFGAGKLATPLLPGGLPVVSGELHADYVPENSELRLEQLALDLGGGTRLVVDGQLGGLAPKLVSAGTAWPNKLGGSLGITLTNVPTTRLDALWPQGVAKGGRRWATANLADGVLDEVAVRLAVAVDPEAPSLAFSNPRGTMRFHDMTVTYLDTLPPARKVAGTAALADRRLDFTFTGGQLKTLKATGGTVTVTDLGAPVETMTIDLPISGPLRDALAVLDSKPYRYAHEIGIDPAHIGGKAEALLHFKLPLVNDLKFDQVDYAAKATLADASIAKVALDRNLTDANLTLDLTRNGVHLQGAGKFDGSPTTLDGNIFFHAANGARVRYRVGLSLDDAARQRLGWDVGGDRLTGPIKADLTYAAPLTGSKATLDAILDLSGARIRLFDIGWEKPPQVPGTAKLSMEFDNEALARIPSIDLKAPGLDGQLALTFGPGKDRPPQIQIRRLLIADNDLTGTVSRRPDGGWYASIRAARLDVHRALKRALDEDGPGEAPPLQIDARVARLVFGPSPHRELHDVTAALARGKGVWQSVKIDGSYANGSRVSVSLLPAAAGARRLRVESDNLGASLGLLGIADNVVGGSLKIDGTVIETGGHQVAHAHVEGADYNLIRAPALAKLLSLASLDGVYGLMSGSGIPFTNLRGDLTFSQGRITLDPMIGFGGALGVTAKGWLNPSEDQIDIDGTLAPAYVLNSIVGNLPVIGSLLTGGEGQGLFAAAFRLTGSNDDPTVTVNPLSALTPGLLRHLFDPLVGTSQTPPTQQAQH
ncbi:MAG TPA: DUF3971 domain-containing protein [Stellaceae bacterium]|nr:DUF3971 domain-containing protein [Stellaceae bacterium]